jgi:hypothetical protein
MERARRRTVYTVNISFSARIMAVNAQLFSRVDKIRSNGKLGNVSKSRRDVKTRRGRQDGQAESEGVGESEGPGPRPYVANLQYGVQNLLHLTRGPIRSHRRTTASHVTPLYYTEPLLLLSKCFISAPERFGDGHLHYN